MGWKDPYAVLIPELVEESFGRDGEAFDLARSVVDINCALLGYELLTTEVGGYLS
jgi:hypothetical protein